MSSHLKVKEAIPPERRNRRKMLWVCAVLMIVLAAAIFTMRDPGGRSERFVWLTPDVLQPSVMEKVRDLLMRWTSPLWRGYWSRQPLVLVSAVLLSTPPSYALPFEFNTPLATNNRGAQIWMLTAAENTKLQSTLKKLPAAMRLGAPRVQTCAGARAKLSMLNGQANLAINLIVKARRDAWEMSLGTTLTETVAATSSNGAVLQTNLAMGCRAMIRNGGALVVRTSNPATSAGTDFFLMLSPVTVDARGKPINR